MKRIYLLTTLLLVINCAGFSQVNKDAIGVRLSSGLYNSAELSYQKRLSDINRFEFNLGYGFMNKYVYSVIEGPRSTGKKKQAILFTAVYHWNFNIANGLNWYIGLGANIELFKGRYYQYSFDPYEYRYKYKYNSKLDYNFGIGSQIGLEYDFNHLNVPILVSLDLRPMIQLQPLLYGEDYLYNNWGAAFSVRYTF